MQERREGGKEGRNKIGVREGGAERIQQRREGGKEECVHSTSHFSGGGVGHCGEIIAVADLIWLQKAPEISLERRTFLSILGQV